MENMEYDQEQGDQNEDVNNQEPWQLRMTSALERDTYILANELWTDCEVVVGSDKEKKIFQCHRVNLAKSSPVMASMLYKCKTQSLHQSTIYLPGIQPSAFREVLSYIYTDAISHLGWEEVEALARAARCLEMPHLLGACLNHLHSMVNVGNACQLFELAQQVGSAPFAQHCFKVMCENAARILEEPSFEQISLKTLTALLKEDTLHVASDIPLMEASIKWAKLEVKCKGKLETPQNLREALGPAFSLLRFLSLSPAQFATFTSKSQLLNNEESLAILCNLSSPGVTDLPPGICRNMETRHGYLFGHGRVFPCQPSMDTKYLSTGKPQWCEFSFDFQINSDLILLGAHICSQIQTFSGYSTSPSTAVNGKRKLNGNGVVAENTDTYQEDLDITFEKPKPRSRVAMHFDSKVCYNSLITMKFDKPLLILKGEKYKLYVHLRKEGWYPTGIMSGTMQPLGADLKFTANKENFFHSLIFTR